MRDEGPWREPCQLKIGLQRSKTKIRELLGGMEENCVSQTRSFFFCLLCPHPFSPNIIDCLHSHFLQLCLNFPETEFLVRLMLMNGFLKKGPWLVCASGQTCFKRSFNILIPHGGEVRKGTQVSSCSESLNGMAKYAPLLLCDVCLLLENLMQISSPSQVLS